MLRQGITPALRAGFWLVISAVGIAGCRGTATSPTTPQPVPLTKLVQFASIGGLQEFAEDLPIVVRDQTTYDQLWKDAAAFRPDLMQPAVDFAHNFLLVASRNVNNGHARGARVDSATEGDNVIEVRLTYFDCRSGCGTVDEGPGFEFVALPFRTGNESFVFDITHVFD